MKTGHKLLTVVSAIALMEVSSSIAALAASYGPVQDFKVEGNQRIETSTIVSYLEIKKGDEISDEILDGALKKLYATGLFNDVSMHDDNGVLTVKVLEKPIINEIIFEGNDKLKSEDLLKEISLKPRYVITTPKVQEAVNRLKDLYKASGRYAVAIDPKMIQLDQNRVNLVFEIKEGEETLIERIKFIGNKHFNSTDLQEVIRSKESRWYRFFSSDDKYDPDRLSYDQELLRKYYLERGYVDFKVSTAIAELSPDSKDFFVTFVVDEGDRYKVGNVKINTTIPDLNTKDLESTIAVKKGEWYNINDIEKTVTKMTSKLGNLQFAFVEIKPGVNRVQGKQLVDVEFNVNEGQKTFVDNINISGNTRTLDEVVRREVALVEGDPYNDDKLKQSEKKIKNLGYFSDVKVEPKKGATPDKTDIDVKVKEQSTGDMSVGAGYSTTDGVLGDFSISENNFLGKGQKLGFSTTLAATKTEFDISFTEPYFLNRDLSAGFDLQHTTKDLLDESSYETKVSGITLRMGYPLSEKWRQNPSYSISSNDIYNVQSSASSYVKQQEGQRVTSMVAQTTYYDGRDSSVQPTEGEFFKVYTSLAGLGGDAKYFSSKITSTYYYTPIDDVTLMALGEAGFIEGWGDGTIRIDERFSLGGDRLRGFADYGVGPRDKATNDALGGNRYVRGSMELSFPSGLPQELGIKAFVFSDAGTLWGVDNASSNDIYNDKTIRASVGTGISWRSPFGPIKINFGFPVMKEDYDKEQKFRLSFDTKM